MTSQLDAANDALHQPVLRDVCVELLAPALRTPGAVLIDCTLGMGGHAQAVLDALPEATVVGIDRDPQALELASRRLAGYGTRFVPIHATYDAVADVAKAFGRDGLVDGVLMDLGVSSLQLDQVERGFSYAHDAPLDMRMDSSRGRSARELLNTESLEELARILRVYGEERFAHKIAARIVARRQVEPLETTGQLVELVREALPMSAMRTGGNPAKRTFQAIRIAVNAELEILEYAISAAVESVRVGGRVVVESYQSLEDRIVKAAFALGLDDTTPAGLPVALPDHQPYLKQLVRGALKASAEQVAANPRAASVRLRAVERIAHTPASRVVHLPRPPASIAQQATRWTLREGSQQHDSIQAGSNESTSTEPFQTTQGEQQ